MLKPLDWLRQAWKSLVTKLSKPVVVFLDTAPVKQRMQFMEMIRPETNGMDILSVIMQPHLVITNLSRHGDRLDYFLVRCSNCNPHFYSRDCYKNAIVYGQSDWIGPATTIDICSVYTDGLGKVSIDVAPNETGEYVGELE